MMNRITLKRGELPPLLSQDGNGAWHCSIAMDDRGTSQSFSTGMIDEDAAYTWAVLKQREVDAGAKAEAKPSHIDDFLDFGVIRMSRKEDVMKPLTEIPTPKPKTVYLDRYDDELGF